MPPRRSATARLDAAQKRVRGKADAEPSKFTQAPRIANELSVSGSRVATSSKALPQAPRCRQSHDLASQSSDTSPSTSSNTTASSIIAPPSAPPGEDTSETPKEAPKLAPSQTTSLINEFAAAMPALLDLLFEAQIRVSGLLDDCSCGRGKRTVTCYECTQYPLKCKSCVLDDHTHHPLHWAHCWSADLRCFVKYDFSSLSPTFSVNLGPHSGTCCPVAEADDSEKPLDVTLVDSTGVHRTRVKFCTCDGIPDRTQQLMRAGFFPASVKQPRTAFSFAVLDQFQVLQMECKLSAYDFCSTLRRATDDTFTSMIPDIFPQFVVVMQVWRIMTAMKRLGQAHGIDDLLPHRRKGNLIVHCPLCPEPGLNVSGEWREIPELLRHLCQLQLTVDGNHQANQYFKNTDPLSESLFGGRGHFPTDAELAAHLNPTDGGGKDVEKTTCTHLNAAEKQSRKKFINMRVSGILNVQCSHVFVKSSVDLELGEKFTITDLAYALALGLYESLDISNVSLRHITSRDLILSYDIACGYLRKLLERFSKSFPHLVAVAARTRGMIPAVHVQNHQDNCMYVLGGAYISCIGHFHGETAEQYWSELNQLGPQTRQMNNGHRQDTLMDHHNNWGWKKTKQMPASLLAECIHARDTYLQHKLRFNSLCRLHAEYLESWNVLDREERKAKGKEVECVYRHSPGKVPSQKSILDALVSKESRPSTGTSSAKSSTLSAAEFIEEGISIQLAQRDLALKIASKDAHSTLLAEKEVEGDTRRLTKRMEAWRGQQRLLMPQVSSSVLVQASESPAIEQAQLFLPSDHDSTRLKELGLEQLVSIESELREGFAFDAITSIQQYVKCIEALKVDKRIHAKGQDQNTRANTQITQVVAQRQAWISHYNANRERLIALGLPRDSRSFPPLTLSDTYRVSSMAKRALGDSRRFDGTLWTGQNPTPTSLPISAPSSWVPTPLVGDISTQGGERTFRTLKRKAETDPSRDSQGSASTSEDAEKLVNVADGWIWRLGGIGKLTAKEVEAWEREGDRVHWFRAEAEMERWREQWEIKLVEFIRCIQSFTAMGAAWEELANRSSSLSRSIYAKKKAATYRQLCFEVEASFASVQAGEPTEYRRGEDVVNYIIRHRRTEIGTFHPKYAVQLFRVFKQV